MRNSSSTSQAARLAIKIFYENAVGNVLAVKFYIPQSKMVYTQITPVCPIDENRLQSILIDNN